MNDAKLRYTVYGSTELEQRLSSLVAEVGAVPRSTGAIGNSWQIAGKIGAIANTGAVSDSWSVAGTIGTIADSWTIGSPTAAGTIRQGSWASRQRLWTHWFVEPEKVTNVAR